MPKVSINYSKTIIYKICCKDPTITDIYIGHTTDLTKRKYQHKTSCCNEKNRKYNLFVYDFIRKNGGWNNWDIVMIEECNLETLQQAKLKERYWLEELKATLNKYIPSRTNKEYREENKDLINEKAKKYHLNHREEKKEYNKQRRKENKEKILEYSRKHYQEIKEKRKETLICDICKLCLRKDSYNRHLKSQYHQNFITLQNV
jgi:predicted GIY-YIG superfamily endonuclease